MGVQLVYMWVHVLRVSDTKHTYLLSAVRREENNMF